MKHIVICGAFGIGSAGDEAGLSVFVDFVKDFAKVTVLMRNPSERYARIYGVSVFPKLEHPKRKQAINRIFRGLNADDDPKPVDDLLELFETADLLVLGPGGFFNEHCRGILRGALPEMYFLAWLAQWASIPVMIYAASASPLTGTYAIEAAGWLLGTATGVSFRDPVSVQVLKGCGVRNTDKIAILPDPVLGMIDSVAPPRFPVEQPCLGLSVRSLAYKGRIIQNRYRSTIRKVLKKWEDGTILAIPQFVCTDGYPDDRMEAKAVIPGGKPSIFVDDSKMLPWEVESCYELVSRALVTRLHAAVFCYRLGKPFTALSYEPKIEGFMQSIGRKALRIDADPDEIYEDLISAPKLAPSHKIDLGGYREIVLEAMS